MVNSIEITIGNGINESLSANLLFDKNKCLMNNKEYEIDEEFKKKIIRAISLWKEEYGHDNRIDSEEFTIIVKTDEGNEKIHGKGIFPSNYQELLELLGDLDEH